VFGRVHMVGLPRVVQFCTLTTQPTDHSVVPDSFGTFVITAFVLSGDGFDCCTSNVCCVVNNCLVCWAAVA